MSKSASSTPLPHVREAEIGDAAGVSKLLGQLGYACTREDAARRIHEHGLDMNQTLLVADQHGELCGLMALDFFYYLPFGRQTCRITAMVIDETHRKSGIGRMLLREAERRARAAGAARVEVTSAKHRDTAHAFYRACGYTESSFRFVKALGDA